MAALPNECMPPFPEPTHLVKQFNRPIVNESAHCNVGFTSEAAFARAHDPVLAADALDDLPHVSNVTTNDIATYVSPPRTPYQVYMRRAPPPWAQSAPARAAVGDQIMRPLLYSQNALWLDELKRMGAGLVLLVHRRLQACNTSATVAV